MVKKILFLCLSYSLLFNFLHATATDEIDQAFISLCQQEITLSKEGINNFIVRVYNHPHYATDFLPFSFSHVLQLLGHGKQKKLSPAYVYSTLRLFNTKVKTCSFISASAFEELLSQLPDLLAHNEQAHNTPESTHTRSGSTALSTLEKLKNTVKEILFHSFLNKFQLFQDKPDDFLEEVSTTITRSVEHEAISSGIILRFLENTIHRLSWPVDDQDKIWDSFKSISCHLENLYNCSLIANSDDLDELYWSLTHRFCIMLDTFAAHLNPSVYAAVKKDLHENSLLIFKLEEQEELMETKAQHLSHALMMAEAKARLEHAQPRA